MVTKKAFHSYEKSYGIYTKAPIRIIKIVQDDIFPVKFEYRQRGYKGLVFSDRLSNILFTD